MMPYIWLILGLILVLLEFYLPGAVLGAAGAVLIGVSLVLYVNESPSIWHTVFFFILAGVSVAGLIKFALWRIPRNKNIYLGDDQQGYRGSTFDSTAISKEAEVLSDLKPGGYILIEGVQHQAISISGYIPKGAKVRVTGGEGESLIVRTIQNES